MEETENKGSNTDMIIQSNTDKVIQSNKGNAGKYKQQCKQIQIHLKASLEIKGTDNKYSELQMATKASHNYEYSLRLYWRWKRQKRVQNSQRTHIHCPEREETSRACLAVIFLRYELGTESGQEETRLGTERFCNRSNNGGEYFLSVDLTAIYRLLDGKT